MTYEEVRAVLREATTTMAEGGAVIEKMRKQSDAMVPILVQHRAFMDVMFEFQRSRWPWVRWVAKRMQEEIVCRLVKLQ